MRRWTLLSRAERGGVILSGAWTTSTCYKPREIERPRSAPVAGGDWAPGQHRLPERRGLAGSAGVVPDVPQLCPAPCKPAPALSAPYSHERRWGSQAVAAVYTGDGGRIDRSRVVAQRGAALSGATMAPAAGSLRTGAA